MTRKPAKARAPAMLYPELPPSGSADHIFWRAAFLRDLATLRTGKALLDKTPATKSIAWSFMHEAVLHQGDEVRDTFSEWMAACNGLAGDGVDGAANGVRQ